MKRNELIELRRLVLEEDNRRKRIDKLLDNDLVKEYLELTDTKYVKFEDYTVRNILEYILPNFTVTKTNGIYVCTSAYYIDYNICYEETYYYSKDVNINSKYAEHKIYTDIESGEVIEAIDKDEKGYGRKIISSFEKDNIVLNPHNKSDNKNGYDDVRLDFFETAVKSGQERSKQLLLKKYKRL